MKRSYSCIQPTQSFFDVEEETGTTSTTLADLSEKPESLLSRVSRLTSVQAYSLSFPSFPVVHPNIDSLHDLCGISRREGVEDPYNMIEIFGKMLEKSFKVVLKIQLCVLISKAQLYQKKNRGQKKYQNLARVINKVRLSGEKFILEKRCHLLKFFFLRKNCMNQ